MFGKLGCWKLLKDCIYVLMVNLVLYGICVLFMICKI